MQKQNAQESHEVSPFLSVGHNATINRKDSISKTNMKHNYQKRIPKRSTAFESSLKSLECLNMFNWTNINISSDVDHDTQMFGSQERSLTYRCIISEYIQIKIIMHDFSYVLYFRKIKTIGYWYFKSVKAY